MAEDYSWVGPAIQAVSGMMGDKEAGKLTEQEFALLKEQYATRMGIPLPQLERLVAEQLGPSALSGIQRDDGLRNKQMQALGAYQDIIDSGGMTLDDRVAEEAATYRENGADRSRRAGIMAQLASRGQLNSGAALAASLSSAQDAANRGRQSGQESAARAQRRKMDAYEALSRGAGNLREQDFGEERVKASAQDDINRWNAGERAQAGKYNAGLPQQQFSNQLNRAVGAGGAANNLAAAYANGAQGVRQRSREYGEAGSAAFSKWNEGNRDKKSTYNWGARSEAGERPRGYDASGNPYYSEPDDWSW